MSVKNIPIYMLIFFAFISCRKERSLYNESNHPFVLAENERVKKVIPTKKVIAFVQGIIKDEDGLPLNAVTVTLEGKSVLTNNDGYFLFGEIELFEKFATVNAFKPGYMKGVHTFSPKEDATFNIKLNLLKLGVFKTFSSRSGGEIDFEGNKVKLKFPPNCLVDASSGIPFNGTVSVFSRYIDPAASNFLRVMPGMLVGLSDDEVLRGMISYGMIAVELEDNVGNKLEVAPGKKVQVTVPAKVGAPEVIPIWHFNEKHGIWVKTGEVSKSGSTYIFEADYFSFWNVDIEFDGISGTVVIQNQSGIPISNQPAIVYTSDFTEMFLEIESDNNGESNIILAPEVIGLEVVFPCESYNTEVTLNGDITNVIIADNDKRRGFKLKGRFLGCGDKVYADKFFTLRSSENVELNMGGKTDADGYFEIGKMFCFVDEEEEYDLNLILYDNVTKFVYDTLHVRFNGTEKEYEFNLCNDPLPPVVDIDGNQYNTVKIGNQIWMAENLKTTRLNNGEEIILKSSGFDLYSIYYNVGLGYNYYDNLTNYNDKYGKIYNENVALNPNTCPTGWRVPNNTDWNQLINFLGEDAGGKLKEVGNENWVAPNEGATDVYNFRALPGGGFETNGEYLGMGVLSSWWSSTRSGPVLSIYTYYYYVIENNKTTLNVKTFSSFGSKDFGNYIRCIKN